MRNIPRSEESDLSAASSFRPGLLQEVILDPDLSTPTLWASEGSFIALGLGSVSLYKS